MTIGCSTRCPIDPTGPAILTSAAHFIAVWPPGASLSSKGQGVGAIVGMDTEFHLEPIEGDRTKMNWIADIHVAGPIGSMGQRVFQPIVNQQVSNVLNALEKQVSDAKVTA